MELTAKDSEFIAKVVTDTLPKIGCENLKGIRVGWNNSKRSLAVATGYNDIKLSKVWWPHLSEQQRETAIVHEVCHLGDFYLSEVLGKYKSTGGHGKLWQTLMINAGQKPERLFKETPETLKEILRPCKFSCGCGTFRISQRKYNSMCKDVATGYIYRCTKCNRPINF